MAPDELQREIPELTRLVDAWQTESLDDASLQELTGLLCSSRDARQYFLEQCQIDAELRWRFASPAQIDGTLAHQNEGASRPIAAIVLSGFGFRDDPGFPAVFKKIEACEPLAHQWLHLYLTLRACMFLCLPRSSEAEAAVKAICDELASHPLVDLSPERFAHLACEVTCRVERRKFPGKSGGISRTVASIVKRCVACSECSDVVAIYESFEACVPHHVPADMLRLLGRRYLLEQTPEQIAASYNLQVSPVRSRLAQARLQIWKTCAAQVDACELPRDLKVLSAFTRALDRSEKFDPVVTMDGRHVSIETLWNEAEAWTASSGDRCRQFLTFAILHEALFRRLSLNHLLEATKTRKDEEFHHVVTDLVLHLEQASVQRRHAPTSRRRVRPPRTSITWIAATAAVLLIAASAGVWWGRNSPSVPRAGLPLADRSLPVVEPSATETNTVEPIPSPTLVAVVKTALHIEGRDKQRLRDGAPLYAEEPLEFDSGIVHLTTPSGSEWVLEGPLSVVMKDRGEIELMHGKLVGLNNGPGEPLVVQTPTARVLDKGTEFGVLVGDDQATSVAVYDGAVEFSRAADGALPEAQSVLHIRASFEASIHQGEPLPPEPTRSLHDRAFIRPDEVGLREQRQQGSVEAAEKVAFFELLRVEGLLAYQGFDAASRGEEFVVGFGAPRTVGPVEFGNDLAPDPGGESSSHSLLLSNGSTVFLDFDVSDRSPIARAGLLGPSQLLGGLDGVVWLCWRSKSSLGSDRRFQWTGLSLMHGDTRQSQEPVFIGQPSGTSHLGLQIFNGPEEIIVPLDGSAAIPETQRIMGGDRPHLWVARITIEGDGRGTVAAWCDIDPADVNSTAPQAQQQVTNLGFDRLRLEVSPDGDPGQCAYDEVFLTTTLEAMVEAMARRHQQVIP